MSIKEDLLLWFINFSCSLPDKSVTGSGVNILLKFNEQLAKELNKGIIKTFFKKWFILDLKIIFGVLIQPICN